MTILWLLMKKMNGMYSIKVLLINDIISKFSLIKYADCYKPDGPKTTTSLISSDSDTWLCSLLSVGLTL